MSLNLVKFCQNQLFVYRIVEKINERPQFPEQFRSFFDPVAVFEETAVTAVELAEIFQAQKVGVGVVAVPALGHGLQHVSDPTRIVGRQRFAVDDLPKLLDVVDNGLTHLAQHWLWRTPQAAVESLYFLVRTDLNVV